MINVLFMHEGGKLIRGSEVSLLVLLENLDRTIINPVVLCNRWSFAQKLRHLNIDYTVIDWPEITIDSKVVLQPLKYLRSLFLAYRLIKRNQINLLYSNGGLPCQMGIVLGKIKGLATICHIRAPHPRRYAWMWLFKFADRVIFVSEAVHRSMISKVGFNRTCVIYNAVDEKRFTRPKFVRKGLRRKLGIKRADVVIGQVGSLIPRKGPDILLRAFAGLLQQHCRLKLVLVGGGNESYRQNLQDLAADLGIVDQLVFVGETAEPQRYYAEVFDINVLSSRAEAFGRTLIEAAA
jgi:glycosyltransferase involved in cell wall biosynthesis